MFDQDDLGVPLTPCWCGLLRAHAARYRYFARTLDEKETTLIGDIKPKKLEEVCHVELGPCAPPRCPPPS